MTMELFRHKAAEKKLDLIFSIQDDIPQVIKGDPVRLSQILNNLISNAIKFTEKGFVRLEVRIIESNESSCVLNFKVTDSGIGIAAQKLTNIFETFTQATNDTTRKYGGTGLGLSIVKKLAELQGGFITVESELNKGTSFSVNLPMNFPDKEEYLHHRNNNEDHHIQLPGKLKILVVEDNEINQLIINKLLNDWGVEITNAGNGVEAIDMIRDHMFDIVLMDIEMPEMNGYEATSRIRKQLPDPKNKIPILAMTAHASAKEKEKCFASGMNDYISKPFDPADVRIKIIQLTFASVPVQEKNQSNSLSGNAPGRYTNLTFLKEMSDDNDSFIRDFINLFMQNAPESLAQLQQHLRQKEWEQIRQVAHKIKPSFNYLGLKELHEAAAKIEDYARQGIHLDEIPALIEKIVKTCSYAFLELQDEMKSLTQ